MIKNYSLLILFCQYFHFGEQKIMLGKKLKIAIINTGISQEEFAKKLKINRALVSQWITGFRNPSMKNLDKISKILELPISYFIEEKSENKTNIEEILIKKLELIDKTEKNILLEIKKLNDKILSLEKNLTADD